MDVYRKHHHTKDTKIYIVKCGFKQINTFCPISGIIDMMMFFHSTPTQWLQLLNRFLPDGLDMDAAETPL